MTLEAGLTALPAVDDVGIYLLDGHELHPVHGSSIEGLEDTGEVEVDGDGAGAGDGEAAGRMRLGPRAVTFPHTHKNGEMTFAEDLHELRLRLAPTPSRSGAGSLRLFRWRMPGEYAKRLWYRPAVGKALMVPGDAQRLLWGEGARVIRIVAPDPVVVSDEFHSVTFAAGQTRTITNEGFMASKVSWWLEGAPAGTAIEHLDFPNEYVRFPNGPVTTTPSRGVYGPAGTYGVVKGRGSTSLFQWPMLRPGPNQIKASKACTFYWRHT